MLLTLVGCTDHGYPTMYFFRNGSIPLTLGQRSRLRREPSLNAAVVCEARHSAELIAFAARSRSDSRGASETTTSQLASADVDQARELGHVERGELG